MSDPQHDRGDLFDRIHDLVTAQINGEMTPEQFAGLDALLADSAVARRVYVQYIYETLSLPLLTQNPVEGASDDPFMRTGELLGFVGRAVPPEPVAAGIGSAQDPPPSAPIPLGLFGSAWQGTVGFFSQEIPFAILVTTIIMGVAGVIGLNITKEHYTQMPGRSVPSAERSFAAAESDGAGKARAAAKEQEEVMQLVGRITGMVDCRWADSGRTFGSSTDYLVALHDKYSLTSGLMEITYDTGAKVILQGPCTYEVDSAAGGYLSLGKLTAQVEKSKVASGQWLVASESAQSRNPSSLTTNHQPLATNLFAVRTPTAVVTDLGTEFGVEVDNDGAVEAQVFEGRIEFQTVGLSGQPAKIVQLAMNEAVRLEKNGTISRNLPVHRTGFAAALAFKNRTPMRAISVNFANAQYNTEIPVLFSAGVVEAWGWNNTRDKKGVLESLIDDQGKVTSARIVWQSTGTWGRPNPNIDNGSGSLMAGHLDTMPAEGVSDISVEVSNLGPPFSSNGYRVIVYFASDAVPRDGTMGARVTDGAGRVVEKWGKNLADADYTNRTEEPFVEIVGTSPKDAKPGNYAVFSGLRGTGFKIAFLNGGPNDEDRARPCGLQIISNVIPALEAEGERPKPQRSNE